MVHKSIPESILKFHRRNWKPLALSAVIVLILGLGVLITTHYPYLVLRYYYAESFKGAVERRDFFKRLSEQLGLEGVAFKVDDSEKLAEKGGWRDKYLAHWAAGYYAPDYDGTGTIHLMKKNRRISFEDMLTIAAHEYQHHLDIHNGIKIGDKILSFYNYDVMFRIIKTMKEPEGENVLKCSKKVMEHALELSANDRELRYHKEVPWLFRPDDAWALDLYRKHHRKLAWLYHNGASPQDKEAIKLILWKFPRR